MNLKIIWSIVDVIFANNNQCAVCWLAKATNEKNYDCQFGSVQIVLSKPLTESEALGLVKENIGAEKIALIEKQLTDNVSQGEYFGNIYVPTTNVSWPVGGKGV